jgi:DnaJ family protein C protein 8
VPQEKAWEATRDTRVASWRDFQTKKKKKGGAAELKPPKVAMEGPSKSMGKRPAKIGEGPGPSK